MQDTSTNERLVSSTKMQPTWNTPPEYKDLKADYDSATNGQEEYKARLSIWETTRNGGAEVKVRTGKSTARPKLVREHNEWKYSALTEPILGTRDLFKISPRGGEDVNSAKQNSLLLNYQWSTKIPRTNLIDHTIRTLVDEGTVIIKTGWDSVEGVKLVETEQPILATPEESIQLIREQLQTGELSQEQATMILESGQPMIKGMETVYLEEETLVKNQPSYEVCINANIIIDPTCDGVIQDALFAIHEYETSYAELKLNEVVMDKETDEISGFYYNLEHIKNVGDAEYDEYRSDESNNFEFQDDARKRLKAYEYWGYWDVQGDGELTSIVATWVNNTLIRLEENPFPHGRPPFSVATYMPVKKQVHGEPDADILKENQDSVGRMTRAIHDITAQKAVGQEFIDEQLFPSPSQKNAYEKGQTVYYRTGMDPKRAIYKNDIQEVGQTPFNVIAWQEKKAAEMSGTQGFSGSQNGNKLNGNTQQRDSMDPASKRELSILRRVSAMLVDMARMTISMNQAFLSETEVVRITGDQFVTIARDDLEGNFDLSVEISTPEKDEDQATKIMKLMQTNAANMDPEIAKMHYVKMAELWKLPDLADEVANYQPKPDPVQQEIKALALEEQKLKNAVLAKTLEDFDSKIYERLSRTEENVKADTPLKVAKAAQANATAEKLTAESDVIDQEFLSVDSGKARAEELENKELDSLYKEREQTNAVIDKNIKLVL